VACGARRRAWTRDLLEWWVESGWGAQRGVGWPAEPENGWRSGRGREHGEACGRPRYMLIEY
jgi:hypothetical protein